MKRRPKLNLEKYKWFCEQLNKLPSIGQNIGTLTACMRRCRRTDSPKWIKYDQAREKLLAEQAEIISDIKLELAVMESPE